MELGKAKVVIETDDSGLDKGLEGAKKKAEGFGGVMKTALGTAAGYAAAQSGLQGIAGAFDFLVGNAASFEKALGAVAASTGSTTEEMAAMRDLAMDIGAKTSKSASEAVLAMGELAKAGMPVQTILEGAGLAAVQMAEATGVTVPQAAVMMSNAMNVFSADGKTAAEVADLFARTAGASAIGVEDLAQGMASGGAAAVAAGLSIEDFANVIGIMGNNGIAGAEAGTGLKSMLNGLTPVTDKAKDAMREMGFSAFDANGNMKPLRQIIGEYAEATKDMTQEQKLATGELIFGSYGVNTMNTLVREGVEGWDGFTEAMGKAPSVAEQSALRMAGLAGQWETFMGSVETISISIGSVLLPALTALMGVLIEGANLVIPAINLAFNTFKSIIEAIPEDVLIGIGVALGVIAAPTIIAGIIALTAAVVGYTISMAAAAVATLIALAPWILLAAAIAALVVGIIYAIRHWDEIKAKVTEVAQAIVATVTAAFNSVTKAVSDWATQAWADISGAWEKIKDFLAGVLDAILGFFEERWRGILLAISAPLAIMVSTIVEQWTHISGFLSEVLAAISSAMSTAWEAISSTVSTVVNAIVTEVTASWNHLKEVASSVWNAIKSEVTQIATDIYNWVRDRFNEMVAAVSGPVNEAKDAVVGAWEDAKAGVSSAVQGLVDGAVRILETIIEKARQIGRDAGNALLSSLKGIPGVSAALDVAKGIGGAADAIAGFTGFKAGGGRVNAGQSAIVGDAGWELWVPDTSGRILSHEDSIAALGGGGMTVNMPGATIYATDQAGADRGVDRVGWGLLAAARSRGL